MLFAVKQQKKKGYQISAQTQYYEEVIQPFDVYTIVNLHLQTQLVRQCDNERRTIP